MHTLKTTTGILAIMIMMAIACQKPVSEPVIEEEITMPDFLHVKVTGIEHVEVVKENLQKVKARMPEDAHLRLRARVIDDTLMLDAQRPEDGMLKGFITISVPDALSVTLSGQGTGMIHGFSGVDKFMIVADNKRRVTAKVSANELRVNAANETNLLLEGQGRSIILSATNRSLINAVDYPVLFSSAIAEENTIIYTNVANTLNASAVKNSIVNYKGNPLNLFTSELESGKVMPID